MTEHAYQHVAALDDPAKPHRKVWFCPATNIFVKTHCVRLAAPFGEPRWKITGSLCNDDGKAAPFGDGHAVLEHKHLYQLRPDQDVDVETELRAEVLFMVAQVERATLLQMRADGIAPLR